MYIAQYLWINHKLEKKQQITTKSMYIIKMYIWATKVLTYLFVCVYNKLNPSIDRLVRAIVQLVIRYAVCGRLSPFRSCNVAATWVYWFMWWRATMGTFPSTTACRLRRNRERIYRVEVINMLMSIFSFTCIK